jgi:hypothetical protein
MRVPAGSSVPLSSRRGGAPARPIEPSEGIGRSAFDESGLNGYDVSSRFVAAEMSEDKPAGRYSHQDGDPGSPILPDPGPGDRIVDVAVLPGGQLWLRPVKVETRGTRTRSHYRPTPDWPAPASLSVGLMDL